MGRQQKIVLTSEGVDRRETGYYSTPRFVSDFLGNYLLGRNPHGALVFDPCVGKEELLAPFAAANKQIDAIDIEDHRVHRLARYKQTDFFAFLGAHANATLPHDYLVANPPYNCHESAYVHENKKALQSRFADTGVANLYSMFIAGLIDLAKPGALLGLVTLDSFLTARMHEGLRRKILAECSVHLLALSPTDLFRDQNADVRTCLLVLQKGRQYQGGIDILNRPASSAEFEKALETNAFTKTSLGELVLDGPKDHAEFVIACPAELRALFHERRLGESFPCITGISTGNDAQYLSKRITGRHTVPFYKNPGSRRFYCEPDAYLPADFLAIADSTPNFNVRNRSLLMREAVVCSSMGVRFGACYRPAETTFGVNANVVCSGEELWTTLAFLNSSLATYLVRGVLLRSNMITSGYVARIPLPPLPSGSRRRLSALAQRAVTDKVTSVAYPAILFEINREISQALAFSPAMEATLHDFQTNLVALT